MARLSVIQWAAMESNEADVTPGQFEVEVVAGLEEGRRGPVDVGEGLPDEQDVGHRILAGQPRGPSGHLHPPDDLAGVVPEHVDRSAGHPPDGLVAPGVHPDDRAA